MTPPLVCGSVVLVWLHACLTVFQGHRPEARSRRRHAQFPAASRPRCRLRSLEAQLQAGLARALGWFHGRQVEDDGPLRALPCS